MKTCMSYSHRFECECDRILPLRLNKLERSNGIPNHLFVCKFEQNNETTKIYVLMKTCVSYSHRFECEGDRILLLRLNKLERSNRTPNHLFVCKFE